MTTADELRSGAPNEALLLTPEEAARLLRVGRTTVYALMKTGDLRPVHIGRSCRLARTELERYVNRLQASGPTAADPLPRGSSATSAASRIRRPIVQQRSPRRPTSSMNQRELFDIPTEPGAG